MQQMQLVPDEAKMSCELDSPLATEYGVGDFPKFEFSMKDVLRAGEALAGDVPWNSESDAAAAREIFKIAHNFRDSHAYPMRAMRYELQGRIKRKKIKGALTAARLKRMPSIRRKLANNPGKLNQIQDLAGVRAVLPSIQDVTALIAAMRNDSKHELFREYDYINGAKESGYRSHHMVFKFRGDRDEAVYDTRRVEVQIRTGLQHSWATAVESVGLFRGEDFKAGQGSRDWLRLFELTSQDFAVEEGCRTSSKEEQDTRVQEIMALSKKLDAVDLLDRLSQAFSYAEDYRFDPNNKPDYFKITYVRSKAKVSIEPQFGPTVATQRYDAAEVKNEADATGNDVKIVLVEVDGIENLRSAYPNYFGDVQLFRAKLSDVSKPIESRDYSYPPQQTVKKIREKPDDSWLRRRPGR